MSTADEAAIKDETILSALTKLDPANDDHWTSTGQPAMDALNALLPAAITRKRLEEVAPDFKRPIQEPAPLPREGDGVVEGDPPSPDEVIEKIANLTLEERLNALELIVDYQARDLAFLRALFGWPTKDA